MTETDTVEETAAKVWDHWLDGDSIAYIARNTDASPAKVKAILAADPPEKITSDLRYVHGCRALWIAISTFLTSGAYAKQAFVPVFQPRRCTSDVFVKAVRRISRKFNLDTGGTMDLGVLEGMDMDTMIKFVRKGYLAFRFDEEGNLVDDIPGAEPTEGTIPAPK